MPGRVTSRSVPRQADRLTEALADTQRHQDRQRRAAMVDAGKLHRDVAIPTGDEVRIAHGLRRGLTTWIAQRVRADGAISHHVPREVSADGAYLTLANDSGIDVVIDVWVE